MRAFFKSFCQFACNLNNIYWEMMNYFSYMGGIADHWNFCIENRIKQKWRLIGPFEIVLKIVCVFVNFGSSISWITCELMCFFFILKSKYSLWAHIYVKQSWTAMSDDHDKWQVIGLEKLSSIPCDFNQFDIIVCHNNWM